MACSVALAIAWCYLCVSVDALLSFVEVGLSSQSLRRFHNFDDGCTFLDHLCHLTQLPPFALQNPFASKMCRTPHHLLPILRSHVIPLLSPTLHTSRILCQT
ncbi:hypothetical protein KC19_VG067500 [Ceratodon purpureus]|uniref:Secreted protein n=1 Tax=Ceratodon purpureus TaxID=3225 RepID=A0A8T0HMP4_CERPU|nr:hypothetical protein KC19_VG067500 [Ceratodon purpureus]